MFSQENETKKEKTDPNLSKNDQKMKRETKRDIFPDHWIVLCHGINGQGNDMDHIRKGLEIQFSSSEKSIHVMTSRVNEKNQTHLGIQFCGQKLAIEIMDQLIKYFYIMKRDENNIYLPNKKCFMSFVAHSLGGLIIGHAIVYLLRLFENKNKDSNKYIELTNLIEFHFHSYITLSTPHLGVRKPFHPSLGKNVIRNMLKKVIEAKVFYGDTGLEVTLYDQLNENHKSEFRNGSLFDLMYKENSEYLNGLKLFRIRTLVSIINGDFQVPFSSASISSINPYDSIITKSKSIFSSNISFISNHSMKVINKSNLNIMKQMDRSEKINNKKIKEWNCFSSGFNPPLDDCLPMFKKYLNKVNTFSNSNLDFNVDMKKPDINGFVTDLCLDIEYKPFMLENLLKMEWRRLDIFINTFNFVDEIKLHNWTIGKNQQPNDLSFIKFINFLCAILRFDIEQENKEKK